VAEEQAPAEQAAVGAVEATSPAQASPLKAARATRIAPGGPPGQHPNPMRKGQPVEPNVSASQSEAKPDPFADLVRELHAVASDLSDLIGSGLPAPSYFALDIHPGGRDRDRDDDRTAQAVDALGLALLGKPGASHKMLDGTYHYGTGEHRRGPIEVHVYDSVDTCVG
jgi:hypothetical protein